MTYVTVVVAIDIIERRKMKMPELDESILEKILGGLAVITAADI